MKAKYFCFCIFFIIVCWHCSNAQVKEYKDSKSQEFWYNKDLPFPKLSPVIDSSYTSSPREITEVDKLVSVLKDLFEEYKQVCWADSNLVTFNLYCYGRGDTLYSMSTDYDFDLGINPAYIGKRDIWTHREPDFKDFMDWLDKERQ